MNKQRFFYCGSTQAILYALSYSDFIVVSKSIVAPKLCSLHERQLIIPNVRPNLRDVVLKSHTIKSEINRLLKVISDGELHFSHTQFDVFCFLLVNAASKKGLPVYFHNFEFVYKREAPFFLNNKNLSTQVLIFLAQRIYGINMEIAIGAGQYIPAIDPSNINMLRNIQTVDVVKSFNQQLSKVYLSSNINIPRIQSLFITQNLKNNSNIDQQKLSMIYSLINDLSIKVKFRPGSDSKIFANADLHLNVDHELPVEYYFNSVGNYVISIYSTALVSASYFPHLKSIALIKLVTGSNVAYCNEIIKYLTEYSGREIFFPATTAEFLELIS